MQQQLYDQWEQNYGDGDYRKAFQVAVKRPSGVIEDDTYRVPDDGEDLTPDSFTVKRLKDERDALKAERDVLKAALANLLQAAAGVYDAYINTLMDNDGDDTPAAKLLYPNGGNPMTDGGEEWQAVIEANRHSGVDAVIEALRNGNA